MMFTIHLTKYYLTQTQYLFLLGFETDLYKMTASLKEEKKQKICTFGVVRKVCFRDLAIIFGNLVVVLEECHVGSFTMCT